jgi:hypothetical protein
VVVLVSPVNLTYMPACYRSTSQVSVLPSREQPVRCIMIYLECCFANTRTADHIQTRNKPKSTLLRSWQMFPEP